MAILQKYETGKIVKEVGGGSDCHDVRHNDLLSNGEGKKPIPPPPPLPYTHIYIICALSCLLDARHNDLLSSGKGKKPISPPPPPLFTPPPPPPPRTHILPLL